ncbi:MAG: hypothetical protein ABSD10_03055 [Candidatus Saccharimonadales bacterium]|jgi:hypothetical protein
MPKKFKKISRRRLLIATVSILVIAGIVLALLLHFHKSVTSIPTLPTPANQSSASNKLVPSNSGTSSVKNGSSPSSNTSNVELAAPYGTLVSNHRPNLGGSPAPSQEQSVCNTTVGATCYIEFTQGSTVKKLDAQTVDSTGTAIWTWDVSQAGFSQGTWQITAVATLGGQTKTTADPTPLEVLP